MGIPKVKILQYNGRPLFQSSILPVTQGIKTTFEDVACFLYVFKGQVNFNESSGSHIVKKEEGLVKSCGNVISKYLQDQEGNDFEAVLIYFYPDMLKEIFSDISGILNDSSKRGSPKKIVGNELIEKFINGLHLYFENEELLDDNLSKLKVKELIMILLKSNYFESVIDLFNQLFSPKNKSFREIITNNLFSNIPLDQLAFLTHRSLSTFRRDFKKEFNQTPAKYIKGKRLEHAAECLVSTDESITDIAFACGYEDMSTFSVVFRELYDQSPSAFRLTRIRKSLN